MDFFENEELNFSEYLNKLRITVNKLKQAFVSGEFFENAKIDSFYFYKKINESLNIFYII